MICARSRPFAPRSSHFRSKSTRARQMPDHATANSGSHLPGDAAEPQYPETAGPGMRNADPAVADGNRPQR